MQIDSCRRFCSARLFKGERTEKNLPLRWIRANWLKYMQHSSMVLMVLLFGVLEGLFKDAKHPEPPCMISVGSCFQRGFNWTQWLAGWWTVGGREGIQPRDGPGSYLVSTANCMSVCLCRRWKLLLVIRPISVSNAALLWIIFIRVSWLYLGHVYV